MGRIFDEQGKRKPEYSLIPQPSPTPSPTSGITSTIPSPNMYQRPAAFSEQDPGIVKSLLLGLFPGLAEALEEKKKQEEIRNLSSLKDRILGSAQVAKAGTLGGLKWLAGIPEFIAQGVGGTLLQAPKTGFEMLGKPGVIPERIGPIKSLDLQKRELQAMGAGPLVSTLVPSGSAILANLGLRSQVKPKVGIPQAATEIGKPKEIETPAFLREETKPTLSEPAAGKNLFSRIMDRFVGEETRGRIKREIPIFKESEQVKSIGPSGAELVTRGRRAQARQMIARGEFTKLNKATGYDKFTLDEKKSLIYSLEGKAQPFNEKVAKAVPVYQEMFDKWGDLTKVEKIPSYAPRRFNQFGIQQLLKKGELPTDLNKLVNDLAEKLAMDPLDVRQMLAGGKRKSFFEYERVLDDIPGEYRDFNAITEYQKQAARRYGIIQEFGKEEQTARSLINRAAEEGTTVPQQEKYRNLAQDYFDRVAGKTYTFDEIAGVNRYLRDSMIVSKLNPLTTMANETQGHVNAWLMEGTRGLKDVMTKDGGKIVKELGLENLSGMRVGDKVQAQSFAGKWMKAIGFEGSEKRNVARAAAASDGIIGRYWNVLKNDPQNAAARTRLQKLGMFIDDAVLKEALKKGELPPEEYAIGVIEGVRQMQFTPMVGERPKFASTPKGQVAWIFHQYLLEQMRLLKDAPTHRQIAYLALIAPMTGIPMGLLRNVVTGREQPKDLAEWYSLGYRYGPGTPFELVNPIKNPYYTTSYLLGGYKPPVDVLAALTSGKPVNVMEQLFRANQVPLASVTAPRLFDWIRGLGEEESASTRGGNRIGAERSEFLER